MKKENSSTIEIVDNKRYRNFMFLFYDDTKSYKFDDLIFNLHSFKYYAYIKHEPEQEEKKAHYHGFINLDTATTELALSKRLGIPPQHIQYVKNVRAGCRYLTHIDYEDKIQYSLDDVKVSGLFKRKFLKNFEDIKTEEEIINDIYAWVDNFHYANYFIKMKHFIKFININCYDTIYRRYRYELNEYLRASTME